MWVTLASYEMRQAALAGAERQIQAVEMGLSDRHGIPPDKAWQAHIEGALGEMALAKLLNRYYDFSVGTFRDGGDVGNVQVRTRSQHGYDLIIRPDDADDKYYVHVTGLNGRYAVRGYILGREAKEHPEWLQTHGCRDEAFFVPEEALDKFKKRAG